MRDAWLLAAGLLLAVGVAASCEDDPDTPPALTSPTGDGAPVCGNAKTEAGEQCDPYADEATWACPTQHCTTDCTCTDDPPGTGGFGASGGSGGTGGVGAGLPVGGDGTIDCDTGGAASDLKLTAIVAGLEMPVLAHAPVGEANRLYILEQEGIILLYEDGESSVFLDIQDRVSCCGERGLLGLAFHPDYVNNGRFFVHYSDGDNGGATAVAEYQRDPSNADRALPDPVGGAPFFTANQPAGNHNGGTIEISPNDGHLYIFLGDGGGANDTFMNGQDITTVLGSIVRIDISAAPVASGNYPSGNAFNWAVGLRNPYRSSFDACTGDIYIADVGQATIEEVNVEPAATPHRNYGWNTAEGSQCFPPGGSCDMTGLTLPAAEYDHDDGDCSVTGGFVYRGSAIPWLRGTYFYGDYCTGRIWSFVWDGNNATSQVERTMELGSSGIRISSFGQDASGEVYVISYQEGVIYRIEAESS